MDRRPVRISAAVEQSGGQPARALHHGFASEQPGAARGLGGASEIVGGPPAGFSPDGATAVEVMTNAAGQASAGNFSEAARPRHQYHLHSRFPAGRARGQRLLVASSSTLKTWTAADIGVVSGTTPPSGPP